MKNGKRMLSLAVCLLLAANSFACSKGGAAASANARTGSSSTGVADVLQSRMDKQNAEGTPASEIAVTFPSGTEQSAGGAPSEGKSKDGIDLDLTTFSSTMVYSEVLGMLYEPDSYMGKVVKMKGNFSVYHDDVTGKDYFACIIQDATACCAQGIEFRLKGDPKYPEGYPEEGAEITVVGTFSTYMEGNDMYLTLKEATLL